MRIEEYDFLVSKCKGCGAIDAVTVISMSQDPNWLGQQVLDAYQGGRAVELIRCPPITMPQECKCTPEPPTFPATLEGE